MSFTFLSRPLVQPVSLQIQLSTELHLQLGAVLQVSEDEVDSSPTPLVLLRWKSQWPYKGATALFILRVDVDAYTLFGVNQGLYTFGGKGVQKGRSLAEGSGY